MREGERREGGGETEREGERRGGGGQGDISWKSVKEHR